MDLNCQSCHQNIHQGILASKFYPDQTCTTCHNTQNWKSIRFDHNQTKYPLQAKHHLAACGSCHMKDKVQQFSGLSTKCASCHADAHGKQFEQSGQTDCARCHQPDGWNGKNFNHSTTSFTLDGEHKMVTCTKCHNRTLASNPTIRYYKIERFECIDCHL
jgi:hypothetical protein